MVIRAFAPLLERSLFLFRFSFGQHRSILAFYGFKIWKLALLSAFFLALFSPKDSFRFRVPQRELENILRWEAIVSPREQRVYASYLRRI